MIRNYANIQYLVYCITGVEDLPTPSNVHVISRTPMGGQTQRHIVLYWVWTNEPHEISAKISLWHKRIKFEIYGANTPKGLWIKTVIDFIEDGRKSRPPLYPYLSKNYWQDLNDFRYLQLEIARRSQSQLDYLSVCLIRTLDLCSLIK